MSRWYIYLLLYRWNVLCLQIWRKSRETILPLIHHNLLILYLSQSGNTLLKGRLREWRKVSFLPRSWLYARGHSHSLFLVLCQEWQAIEWPTCGISSTAVVRSYWQTFLRHRNISKFALPGWGYIYIYDPLLSMHCIHSFTDCPSTTSNMYLYPHSSLLAIICNFVDVLWSWIPNLISLEKGIVQSCWWITLLCGSQHGSQQHVLTLIVAGMTLTSQEPVCTKAIMLANGIQWTTQSRA